MNDASEQLELPFYGVEIPFVIDNQQHKMYAVLNSLLAMHTGHSLDIATAYLNVGGWRLLKGGLVGLGTFRLLLGDEPESSIDLGLRESGARPVKGLIHELSEVSFNAHTLDEQERVFAANVPGLLAMHQLNT